MPKGAFRENWEDLDFRPRTILHNFKEIIYKR